MAYDDIQGKAIDNDGNPIGNHTIYLINQDNPNEVVTTTTDANGNYVFDSHVDAQTDSENYLVAAEGYDTGTELLNTFYNAGVPADLRRLDSGLLHRYDATELTLSDGESVTSWPDEAGSDDLSTGTAPTFRENIINGNPVVRHDGQGDNLTVNWTNIAAPYEIFTILVWRSIPNKFTYYIGGDSSIMPRIGHSSDSPELWMADAGSRLNGSAVSADTEYITATLFDGANSQHRVNGTTDSTDDAGSNSMQGLTTGLAANDANDFENYGEVDLGEILVYDPDASGYSRADVESYLSDKWGISV